MMDINATLIVQALNFALAYVLLKNLLFKPALRIVEQEEKNRKDILDAIEKQSSLVKEKELALVKNVQQYQQKFAQEIPDVEQENLFIFKGIAPQIAYIKPSDNDIKQLADEIVPSLLHKVEHVQQ